MENDRVFGKQEFFSLPAASADLIWTLFND